MLGHQPVEKAPNLVNDGQRSCETDLLMGAQAVLVEVCLQIVLTDMLLTRWYLVGCFVLYRHWWEPLSMCAEHIRFES